LGDAGTYPLVEARPIEYGRTGVNSYAVANTGEVQTHLDRSATLADPTIPSCRYVDSVAVVETRCAALATPPADFGAAFKHPEAVAPDSSFIVSVRLSGDTSQPPTGGVGIRQL